MGKAVLFKSDERFDAFFETIRKTGMECDVLDFSGNDWLEYDYETIDFLIYYPSFRFSSNCPLALFDVVDNLTHIKEMHPDVIMYPDPGLIRYYNDKYRQCLFLKRRGFPIPPTVPLVSGKCVEEAEEELGYPMVVKNRYGAGGASVFKVGNRKELLGYYKLSMFDFFNASSLRYFLGMCTRRRFYYALIKARRLTYPFLSPPLLAQKFIRMDRDIKTVVGDGQVMEAHWRLQAHREQWKVNIDGGGIGQWSRVPEEVIRLSERLAHALKARWLNIDLVPGEGDYLITEFSPVWHHYAYREKPSFVYKDDYNIDTPLEVSLDLEGMIVASLARAAEMRNRRRMDDLKMDPAS